MQLNILIIYYIRYKKPNKAKYLILILGAKKTIFSLK